MRYLLILLIILIQQKSFCQPSRLKTVIAFGSCGHETEAQPILQKIADIKPDYFIYLGDNIYGDTYEMSELKAKYDRLAAKSEYQALKTSTKVLATWDDHDYGSNDTGRHYPHKKESKDLFLNFFDEPADSERRQHEGIYTSYQFQIHGKALQIILLDTRTFRDDLRKYRGELHHVDKYFYPLDYFPHQNTDSTLLGSAQWEWLEKELLKPADVRIIGSSTQFGIEYNGYEAWANFPHEQKKMTELIKKTKANGVVFISGDVHYAEISKYHETGMYPLYDFTSSGITSTWHFATPNSNRIEGPVMDNHYGKIIIDWSLSDPTIKMEAIDVNDNPRFEYTLQLSALKF